LSKSDSDGCNAQSVDEEKDSVNNYDMRTMTPQLIIRPTTPSIRGYNRMSENATLHQSTITETKIDNVE